MAIKRSLTSRDTIKIWIIAVGGIISLVFIPSTFFERPGVFTLTEEFREGRPTYVLDPDIVASTFIRHCNWEPPASFLRTLNTSASYSVPLLVKTSLEKCPTSALPFPGVDIWYNQADVRILAEIPIDEITTEIQKSCNDNRDLLEACVIFMPSYLIHDRGRGISLLLQVLEKPFVLITADNRDECVPYETIPRDPNENVSADVNMFINSPLLIRWYTKNLCIHPGHTDGKFRALPLGPKWQWHSGEFEAESKEPVKKKLVDAGAEDPRHLFSIDHQEKTIYVAMTLSTTDNPFYRPYTEIRRKFMSHLESDKLSLQAQGSFWLSIADDAEQSMYLRALANSTFVLSPPGRGLDTHRTWEAFILGAIPIVMQNPLSSLYKGLPVIEITDVAEVTAQNLPKWYERIQKEGTTLGQGFLWEKVTAFWWLQQIVLDSQRKTSSK